MTDLHDRFATLDGLRAPGLWHDIQVRAVTRSRFSETRFGLALLVAATLLTALLGGVVLVASGMSSASPQPTGPARPTATVLPARPAGVWTRTSHMLEGRIGHTATLLPNGLVLVAGGLSEAFGVGRASAELYDPTAGTWKPTGSMHEGRAWHSAALLRDGSVMVIRGVVANDTQGEPVARTSAEIYDPSAGTWTLVAGPSAGEGLGAVVLQDGRVLVTGGYDERARRQVGIAEFYNPYTEAWSDAADARFPAGRSATILLDGRVLVVLADPSSRDLQTAFYDPGMASWAAGPDLPERFGGQTSVLLQDGRVLFAGGDVPNGPGANGSAHTALFDPVTGSWRLAAPMPVAPLGQTATVLPDGRVLATGGKEYGGPEAVHFSNAELYDPVTGTWITIDAMAVARDGHTATLLPDGRVLIAGGEARGGASIDVAELYQPGDIR